ncbi:MAG: tyrosine-type recombinase/integrase [Verrucomicrobia bacterium]|nr:tyrosine-type recombinase/integrase [Verrucomicrobiota bacterium]
MRRSELTSLELTAVNQERGTAQVRQGKGRKDWVVPVGSRALQWLERYCAPCWWSAPTKRPCF